MRRHEQLVPLPFGFAASATVFSYAMSFAFTDTISELFGPSRARQAVIIGFVGLILSVAFFQISIHAPPAEGWGNQSAYQLTLGHSFRLLLGGWTSYAISQNLDVWIFHKVREKTQARHLWLRNNVSTAVSQFIDTCIFITVAFYGVFPIWNAILGQYLLKLIIAAIDTPLVPTCGNSRNLIA